MSTEARGWLLACTLALAACGAAPDERVRESDDAETSRFATADSLHRLGRYAEAASHYAALRDSFAIASETAHHWSAQHKLAFALGLLGQRDEAEAAFAEALVLAADDAYRQSRTRGSRAQIYSRQGRLDTALAEARAAQELAATIGHRGAEASAWHVIGENLAFAGRYREAIAAHERQLVLSREAGADERDLADVLVQLGINYRHVGRHTDAAAAYEQALEVHRRHGSPEGQARVLFNLSNVRAATGDAAAAVANMLEALGLAEEIGHDRGLALIHGGLGNAYRRAGNLSAARHHIERSLETNRRIGQPYAEAVSLVSMGLVEIAERDGPAAHHTLAAAVQLADSHGYRRERAGARAALARAALLSQDAAGALRWADAALLIADSLDHPEAQFEALEARAAALEALGSAAAPAAYITAIDLLESWRGRLALGDLRMGVAEPRLGVYEGAIRTLLRQSRPDAAFIVAERARARLLLELLAERDSRPDRLDAHEAELRRELRELFEARSAVSDPVERDRLQARIGELTASLGTLEAQALRVGTAADAARHPGATSPDELRTALLGPDRALVAFFWGDRDVYGWWVSAGDIRAARLGAADSLAALVDFLRHSLDAPSGVQWRGPSEQAYRKLIAPVVHGAQATEVLVLPDGPAAHIPLEVLVPAAGAPPWGADRRFVYAPSASVLLALERTPSRADWPRAVLAVGDPKPAEGEDEAGELRRLPYAASEARAIRRLFRAQGADLLEGGRATPERWARLDPSRYRYLHFAAHARIDDRLPERTHLVLAGGTLGLAEIRRLTISAELVTLSACETALGRRVRGEGVIGLPHAFLAAGARGAVVTLWRIDDRAAADFMTEFYRELQAGTRPAAALHAVRRAHIASGGEAAHPSRWAPFVLVGGV